MRHQKTKVADEGERMSSGDANAVTQSPGTSQVRQSPLQHYIMTGQLTPVSVADVSTTQQSLSPRAQMLAQIQGLRVPLNTALSQVTSLNTGVALADQVLSTSTSPAPGTSTSHNLLQSVSANSHQRQLTGQGGMIAVPPVSPVRYQQQQQQTGVQRSATTPSPVSGPGTIILQSADLRELQISGASNQSVQQLTFPSVCTVSASGGTIHHLGQSPTKGGIPPLLNPVQQHNVPKMNVQQLQQALQQGSVTPQQATPVTARRTSGSVSPGSASPRASHGLTHSQSSPLLSSFSLTQNPLRTSPVHSPERPRKRVKLEEKPPATQDIASFRKMICDEKQKLLTEIKENYKEHLNELFFLQNGWNVMDYMTWKKRPTVQLLNFLKSGNLDSDDEELGQEVKINDEVKVITSSGGTTPLATPVAISTTLPPAVSAIQQAGNTEPGKKLGGRHGMVFGHVQQPTATQPPQMPESSGSSLGGVPLVASPTTPGETTAATTPYSSSPKISLNFTTAVTSIANPRVPTSQVSAAPAAVATTVSAVSSGTSLLARAMSETTTTTALPKATSASSSASTSVTPASTVSPKAQLKNPFSPMQRLGTRQHSISAFDNSLGSQEAIVERAKQEAQVMQRVADLRKDGLWTSRRLPKVQEPPRNKAHWDYLLEEMQWLAADFSQERKWKKAGARKISRMIAKYHQDLQQKEIRAEKEEAQKLKKVANNMAKMIKEFWNNVEKVVQYKQQSRLEEKRKRAMDLHLSFIVDQTEKYSSWLTEGLAGGTSRTLSVASSSLPTSPSHSINADDEFKPEEDESDDEETIEKEEAEAGVDDKAQQDEIEALKKESEMPIEEILKNLPKEMLDNETAEESQESAEIKDEKDQEFRASDEEDEDVEDTIAEQEKKERKKDVAHELEELEAENEMSVEELMKKYAGAYDEDFEEELRLLEDEDEGTESEDEGSTEEEEEDDDEEEEMEEEEEEDDLGLKNLMDMQKEEESQSVAAPSVEPAQPKLESDSRQEKMGQELNNIAATAEALQPTGYTLETTQVRTTVPFLLKHTLREYQHVGLDWLATLHERKLNGILADEMGLGKTIQTIALLAHLACDKGVWGPHLIVVPTSVMLNWEMEIKKWCPAFKILTYYGSQKERKLKRQGWTKTNAFHVCITSYKLVVQDHQAFRRKKWKYFILDEAQNIKNFKSQRWQMLLNFSSQRRLLLTGTPLQNSLMELWSLMHFLMPHVFQSHRDFKEWFSNPLTGMIEGSREYNESLIKRLHKVLRPFLLRRLKADVEKQMPKKYEHVVMCYLSKRQRYLYDDFMSNTKTRETLATGHFMSVINVLMQLRKVCNHPNLFDPRPTVSPFQTEEICFTTASVVLRALDKDPLEYISPTDFHPCLADTEIYLPAFAAHRIKKLQTSRPLIEEIDDLPSPPARLKPVETVKPFIFRSISPAPQVGTERVSPLTSYLQQSSSVSSEKTQPTTTPSPSPASSLAINTQSALSTLSLVCTAPTVATTANAISVAPKTQLVATSILPTSNSGQVLTSQPITVQIQHTQQGTRLMIPSGQLSQFPGFIQIVQTSSGQQIIAPSQSVAQAIQAVSAAQSVSAVNGPSLTQVTAAVTGLTSVNSVQLPAAASVSGGKPVMRVSPITQTTASTSSDKLGTSLATITKTTSSSSTVMTPSATKLQMKTKVMEKKMQKSPFYLSWLEERRAKYRKDKLARLAKQNKHICDIKPVYGSDLCDVVRVVSERTSCLTHPMRGWNGGQGYVNCQSVNACSNPNHPAFLWRQTMALRDVIHTPELYLQELLDILQTFVFVVPRVTAPRIRMHCMHPPPSWFNGQKMFESALHENLSPKTALLHPISTRMTVQFPEVRLIQYDCGKLQTLDILLRRLKSGQHRVLIFTQMTKMLDVLESFLNYHGHRYLRLDGTTKVEQRQILMDRFNMDKRIFCFILSTRSGGIGVNLTGADTVIFYDSDWNPTMDAQAQDRCHRIGQTRDVHIYRLVSEMTIEENILKKANQKRLLSNVTIEGGNFTTAFFKENTIQELFQAPSGLKEYAAQQEALEKTVKEGRKSPLESTDAAALTKEQMEQALCQAEDETDVQAAKVVHAEQKAELAEFDENIPWDEKEAEMKEKRDEEVSRVEQELAMLEKELTPVERYAVRIVEEQMAPIAAEELELAEEEVALAKEEWELSRLKALREEEERRAELEEDEVLYTYSRDDALNQVFVTEDSGEQMPMWSPPTPPQDDNDLYIDRTVCFLYEANTMSESQLPPVYVKRENKRLRVDGPGGVVGRRLKVRKDDQPRAPRSLFDRQKLQKLKPPPTLPKLTTKGLIEPAQDHPEWLIHEDWALLQAVQILLELPLSLVTNSPAHIPNWDMVADVVNASSRTYRSPKQCKNRYENVIVLREEGKILYDANPRKQKKTKGLYKTKNNRPMRTSQLYINDNSGAITTLWNLRFDSVKGIAAKRTPTLKPTLANPTQKNPKHAAVLAESNINYEQPLTPIQVADIRARRIAKEKRQSQVAAEQLAQKQAAAQQTANGQTIQTGGTTTVTAVVSTQPQINIVQGQAIQVTSATPSTVVSGTIQKAVTAVSLARSLTAVGTGSIVVNTGTTIPASTIAAINSKRVAHTLSGSPVPTTSGTASGSLAQMRTRVPMAVQEITAVTVANPGQVRAGQVITTTGQVITTTTLTPAQLVAGQRAGVVTATSLATGGATVQHQLAQAQARLTPQQMKALQTRTLQMQRVAAVQAASQATRLTPEQLKQQQQIKRLAAVQQVATGQVAVSTQASASAQKTVSVTTPLITSVGQGTHLPQATRLQFQATQLIAGTTVQGVQSSQPVATFVKALSNPGTATVPSMTIPVSAVNISNVNLMPQKTLGGKNVTHQQLQQLQIRQLQQRKLQQKAQLGVKGQLGQLGVQIIQQQQPKLPVTMQHLQQIVKQQQQAAGNHQPGAIQQIITSVPPSSTSVTTANSQVVVTQSIINTQNITISSPTVSLTTLVKPSPVTVAGQLQTARQVAGPSQVLVSQALKAAQPQQHPSKDVQQTVKQITAHAEAQAQQQRSQVLTSAGAVLASQTGVSMSTVTQAVTTNPVAASHSAQVSVTSPSVTAVLQAPQPGTAQAGDQSQQKASPYTMRLRNPPKH